MNCYQKKISSSIGQLYLVASERGLQGIHFVDQKLPLIKDQESTQAQFLNQAEKEILEYLDQKRTTFQVKLDIVGTDFQKKVWMSLMKIPYGKTKSYKEIAELINNEQACRAVGTANGKNPLCIIIPCHRVIAADGSLGGYSGGLKIKESLLKLEKVIL